MADIEAEIRGLKETQAKMEQVIRDLHGGEMLTGMRDATMLVYRDAVKFVPVDTGRLRSSITPDVRVEGTTVIGVIGSNVKYAPYVETGTRAHWPPPGALAVWARRHGMSEFVVRRSIGISGTSVMAFRRLGTKGWRYLECAIKDNAEAIFNLLGGVVARIVSK